MEGSVTESIVATSDCAAAMREEKRNASRGDHGT